MIVPQSPTAISGLVQQEVRSLLKDHRLEPRQIAILGPASKAKGPLASVTAVDGETVTIDGNHPLAGKTLHFDIEVSSVREASLEESLHGHVHGAGGVEH